MQLPLEYKMTCKGMRLESNVKIDIDLPLQDFAILPNTPNPVRMAVKTISVMGTASLAVSSFMPRYRYKSKKPCPRQQINPPTRKALAAFCTFFEGGEACFVIWAYSGSGDGFISIFILSFPKNAHVH